MGEWVPEGHLVHFILDAVGELDHSRAKINGRGSGGERYPPPMMLGLLIYSHATGVFGSRQIERGTHENAAVRVPCGDTHPDHHTICAFRREKAAWWGMAPARCWRWRPGLARDLEKRDDPPEPPPDAPFVERMAHRLTLARMAQEAQN